MIERGGHGSPDSIIGWRGSPLGRHVRAPDLHLSQHRERRLTAAWVIQHHPKQLRARPLGMARNWAKGPDLPIGAALKELSLEVTLEAIIPHGALQ